MRIKEKQKVWMAGNEEGLTQIKMMLWLPWYLSRLLFSSGMIEETFT